MKPALGGDGSINRADGEIKHTVTIGNYGSELPRSFEPVAELPAHKKLHRDPALYLSAAVELNEQSQDEGLSRQQRRAAARAERELYDRALKQMKRR